MKGFKTLDDVDVKGKTVLVRVDINASLDEDGVPQPSERIRSAAETIGELSDKGAKTVVLAHQGRAGDPDFTSLENHAKMLSQILEREVRFIDDIFGPAARSAISELDNGDILLLENVRFLAEETLKRDAQEHSKSFLVQKLSPLIDIFVNDAFSAAHRSHASLVGFTPILPKVLGRTMERELSSLSRAMENPEKPCVYVLGGLKPEDAFKVMAHGLETGSMDLALTCGVVGRLVLLAKGVDTGPRDREFFEKKNFLSFLDQARELVSDFPERVKAPVDLAAEKDGERVEIDVEDLPTDLEIFDIGSKTAEEYRKTILSARTVVMNGPAGVYEREPFAVGTRRILEAIAESDAFSLMGGGHTITAMEKLGFSADQFSYVSIAGGALISYLGGEKMPAVDAMRI